MAVFVVVDTEAVLSDDGDPSTEDGVAYGYLGVIVGAVLTGSVWS